MNDNPRSSFVLVDEARSYGPTNAINLVLFGSFFAVVAVASLSLQWRRLRSARQRRKDQRREEKHMEQTSREKFSTEKFGSEIRNKHKQSYQELAAELNDMKQMQRDVKSQLIGLQMLVNRLSEKKKSYPDSDSKQTSPSAPKKEM